MNILFVTPRYVESGKPTTGCPAYLYRVSKALIEMGHRASILAVGRHTSHRRDKGIDIYSIYVPYIDYGNESFNYLTNTIKCSYNLNKKIASLIKENKIDIVQFTSVQSTALLYNCDVPAVLRLSSYANRCPQAYSAYSRTQIKIIAFLERIAAVRCKAIYAPCEATATKFGNDCHRRVHVLETPFFNDVEKYDYRYLNKLSGKKYVLFFGSLSLQKGILVISDILEKFLDMQEDYDFVFVGQSEMINGESASSLIKSSAGKHADRITLFKALPHEQLYPVIKEADFVVLPYINDNLPNACLEAMSFEKIVIGTQGGSFEQVIINNENGVLCEQNNSHDLLNKMNYIANMPIGEKNKIEHNAGARIDLLKPEIAVMRLINFYEKLVD